MEERTSVSSSAILHSIKVTASFASLDVEEGAVDTSSAMTSHVIAAESTATKSGDDAYIEVKKKALINDWAPSRKH